MRRIKLLEGGYVRGDALAGSSHLVPDDVAARLVTANVAAYDETEAVQATEIEQLRAQVLELADQLQTSQADYATLKTSSDVVVESSMEVAQALEEAQATIDQLEAERDEAVRLRQEAVTRATDLQYLLDDYAAFAEDAAKGDEQRPGGDEGAADKVQEASGTELPDDYPERDKFIAGGYTTLEAIANAKDEELDKVPGIGDATIKKIREYKPQLQA